LYGNVQALAMEGALIPLVGARKTISGEERNIGGIKV